MRIKYLVGLACGLVIGGVAVAAPPPGTASRPTNTAKNSPYPPTVYHYADVGKALDLKPEQVEKLNKLTEDTQAQYRDKYDKINTLDASERGTRMAELHRDYYRDWHKAARDVFKDDQYARYQQLQYQYNGFNSFSDPDVQKNLSLTPEQVKNLSESIDWNNRQWQAINELGTTDPDRASKMYNEYWTERQERMNKFLTPDQRRAWREMTGDPYTFRPTWGRDK